MARLDGTGPRGEGAMTGRGLGKCNEANIADSRKYDDVDDRGLVLGRGRGGIGRGLGRGRGRGLGFHNFNK